MTTRLLISAVALISLLMPEVAFSESHSELDGEIPGTPYVAEAAELQYCLEVSSENTCEGNKLRRIGIHRINPGNLGARYEYVHKPAFLPLLSGVEQSKIAVEDHWPEVVWDVKQSLLNPNDRFLVFRILFSSQEIRRQGTEILRETPTEVQYVTGTNGQDGTFSLQDISVNRWPVTNTIMQIWGLPDRILLGEAERASTSNDNDIWEFELKLEEENEEILRRALDLNQIEYRFAFKYVGTRATSQATLRTIRFTELQEQIDGLLESRQLSQGDPIFQNEQQSLITELKAIAAISVDGNNPELVKGLLGTQLEKRISGLFGEQPKLMGMKDLIGLRSTDTVAAFLKPIFDELQTISKNYDQEEIVDESRREVQAGFGIKMDGIGADIKVKDVDLTRITNKTGVSFEERETDKILEPHEIAVSTISGNVSDITRQGVLSVQLASRNVRGYDEFVTIKPSMMVTGDFVSDTISVNGASVPIGTALCSFLATAEPPKGYVWVENGKAWPELAQLGPLSGQNMPNTDNLMLAATQTLDKVGEVETGSVRVDRQSIGINQKKSDNGQIGLSASHLLAISPNLNNAYVNGGLHGKPNWVAGSKCSSGNLFSNCETHKANLKPLQNNAFVAMLSNPPAAAPVYGVPQLSAAAKLAVINAIADISISINTPKIDVPLDSYANFPRHMKCRLMVRVQ